MPGQFNWLFPDRGLATIRLHRFVASDPRSLELGKSTPPIAAVGSTGWAKGATYGSDNTGAAIHPAAKTAGYIALQSPIVMYRETTHPVGG